MVNPNVPLRYAGNASVYLIGSQTRAYKVGYSVDLGHRLEAIQRATAKSGIGELRSCHAFTTPYAPMWEKFFHVLFDDERIDVVGREWFDLSDKNLNLFYKIPASVSVMPTNDVFWLRLGINRDDVSELVQTWRYELAGFPEPQPKSLWELFGKHD